MFDHLSIIGQLGLHGLLGGEGLCDGRLLLGLGLSDQGVPLHLGSGVQQG